MATEFTHRIEDAKVQRSQVSASEWSLLLANSHDPEGYAHEESLYIDVSAAIEADTSDDHIDWDCTHFTLADGTKIEGGNLYRLFIKALSDLDVKEAAERHMCIAWHPYSVTGDYTAGGVWRAA